MAPYLGKYLTNYIKNKFGNIGDEFNDAFSSNLVNYIGGIIQNANIFTESDIKEGKADMMIDSLILIRINDKGLLDRYKALLDLYKKKSNVDTEDKEQYIMLVVLYEKILSGYNALSRNFEVLTASNNTVLNGLGINLDISIDGLSEENLEKIIGFVNGDVLDKSVESLSDVESQVLSLLKILKELGIDISKLSLDDIKQHYKDFLLNFPVKLFVNIDVLKEERFQEIRNLAVGIDSNEKIDHSELENPFDYSVFELLRLLSSLGYDISSMDFKSIKEIHNELKEREKEKYKGLFNSIGTLRRVQYDKLRSILGKQYSNVSDDFLEFFIRKTFSDDSVQLNPDNLKTLFESFCSEFFKSDIEKLHDLINKKYSDDIKKYFDVYFQNVVMGLFTFGGYDYKNNVETLYKKCNDGFIRLVADYIISRVKGMPSNIVLIFVKRIMYGEFGDINKILNGEDDNDLIYKLNITMEAYKERKKAERREEAKLEYVRRFVDNLVRNELPGFITKEDYINCLLSEPMNFELGVSPDEYMYKLCFRCYVKKYLESIEIQYDLYFCDFLFEKICMKLQGESMTFNMGECIKVCNAALDDMITKYYKEYVLDVSLGLYFNGQVEKKGIIPSDFVIEYLRNSLSKVSANGEFCVGNVKDSATIYIKYIKKLHTELNDVLSSIKKYLRTNDDERVEQIFSELSKKYPVSTIKRGRLGAEISDINKRLKNNSKGYNSSFLKLLQKSLPYLIVGSMILGGLGAKKHQGKVQEEVLTQIVAEVPLLEPSYQEILHMISNFEHDDGVDYMDCNLELVSSSNINNDPAFDVFVHYPEIEYTLNKLESYGEDYDLLLFSGIEEVNNKYNPSEKITEKQVRDLVVKILNDKRCSSFLKSMFMIGNHGTVSMIEAWKLNCLMMYYDGNISFRYSYSDLAEQVYKYYQAKYGNETGALVTMSMVDMDCINLINDKYDELMNDLKQRLVMDFPLINDDILSSIENSIRVSCESGRNNGEFGVKNDAEEPPSFNRSV